MGNDTVYNVEWQEKYDFLRPGPNEYKAKCEDCNEVSLVYGMVLPLI